MKKFFLTLSLCLFAVTAFAQTTVTGTVSDEKGEPLPSAAILAGGDYAVTDLNGHFSLTTKPGATVTVSYLGFEDYVFTAAAGIAAQQESGHVVQRVCATPCQRDMGGQSFRQRHARRNAQGAWPRWGPWPGVMRRERTAGKYGSRGTKKAKRFPNIALHNAGKMWYHLPAKLAKGF